MMNKDKKVKNQFEKLKRGIHLTQVTTTYRMLVNGKQTLLADFPKNKLSRQRINEDIPFRQ